MFRLFYINYLVTNDRNIYIVVGHNNSMNEVSYRMDSVDTRPFEERLKDDQYRVGDWEPAIYKRLGVELFRKAYLRTVGAVIEKVSGQKFIKSHTRQGLEDAVENTVNIEAMHSVGALLMVPGIIDNFANGQYLRGTIYTGVNIFVNVYPIMMQRSNRKRMTNIIREIERRDR